MFDLAPASSFTSHLGNSQLRSSVFASNDSDRETSKELVSKSGLPGEPSSPTSLISMLRYSTLESNFKNRLELATKELFNFEPTAVSNPVKRPSVSFGFVHIRSHAVSLGDSPAVTSGLPLSLDWDIIGHDLYHVDEHEEISLRRGYTGARRFSAAFREAWLRREGFTTEDFIETSREIEQIKAERAETEVNHWTEEADKLCSKIAALEDSIDWDSTPIADNSMQRENALLNDEDSRIFEYKLMMNATSRPKQQADSPQKPTRASRKLKESKPSRRSLSFFSRRAKS